VSDGGRERRHEEEGIEEEDSVRPGLGGEYIKRVFVLATGGRERRSKGEVGFIRSFDKAAKDRSPEDASKKTPAAGFFFSDSFAV